MKALSLPISSPSRAEKFTPPSPLVRFLSGNVVGKSRNRYRTTPAMWRAKAETGTAQPQCSAKRMLLDTTQEPSSPTVTCIGQVRVRRATAESASNSGHTTSNRRRRGWLKKPLFGYKFSCGFRRYRTFRRLFFRWVLCSRSGYGKKVDGREDSFVVESNQNSEMNGNFEAEVQENVPRNALSLTRCRSVPRRSSSLGGRIRESPLESGDEPKSQQNFQEFRNPSSEGYEELGNTKNVVEDLKGIVGVAAAHPLLLTRCKSGPARTA